MLDPGTTIAGYRIDGVLGEGGMGVVYEATQLSLDRKVALKVLTPRLGRDDGFRRRFRREGRLQAALDHPSIVAVHEAGESPEGLFLAMRLVRGRTLKELVAEGALDVDRTLTILRPIAEALDVAHAAGLIHRDVKPHNVLVGPGDEAYLGDFGLTKAPDDLNLTRSGEFLGTPNYIAPEQVHGLPATRACDVYALGAVLYECLTGVVPFPRSSHAAVLYAHVSAPPPAVTGLRPELPPAVDDVVAAAMAKDPAARPPSATALLAAAGAALAGAAHPLRVPSAPRPRPARRTPALPEPDDTTAPPGGAAAVLELDLTTAGVPDATAATTRLRDGRTQTPPPRPAGPAADPVRRAPVAPVALVAGVAVLAAAGAGLALGGGGPAPEPAAAALATTGLRADLPATWRRSAPDPSVPAGGLRDVVAAAPAGGGGAGLVAGRGEPGSALLPSGLRRAAVQVPVPQRVRLAGGEAFRFRGMRLRDGGPRVTAYVLAATGGSAVLACHGAAAVGSGGAARACERAAGSLRATGGPPVDPGPGAAYAGALRRAVERLDGRREAARRQLRRAGGPAGQERQARALAEAFAAAAGAVRGLEAPTGGAAEHDAVHEALGRAASAYRDLRRAAADDAPRRYDAARRSVERREAAVERALDGLAALGFRTA